MQGNSDSRGQGAVRHGLTVAELGESRASRAFTCMLYIERGGEYCLFFSFLFFFFL